MQKIIESRKEFQLQIDKERSANAEQNPSTLPVKREQEITVCVRYRPLLSHELAQGNFSCASLLSRNSITLHKPEFTRTNQPTINSEKITVDLAFGENDTSDVVYDKVARDLIPLTLGGGVGTLFAYGQTSSGKTYTLVGIQELVARDIFSMAEEYQKKFKDIPLPAPESLLPATPSTSPNYASADRWIYKNPKGSVANKPGTNGPVQKRLRPQTTKQKQETQQIQQTQQAQQAQQAQQTQETQQTEQPQITQQAQQTGQAQITQETQQTEAQKTEQAQQTQQMQEAQQTEETQKVQETQTQDTEEQKRKLRIFVSFFELLGKNAFDLLADKNPISILEDKFGNIQLAGIVEKQIFSTEEFLQNIRDAATLRQSATTLRNDSSSRSHAVCRVRVNNPLFPSSEDGLLMLVDLAGSERAADTKEHSAERLAETKEINTSLMALKDCVRARATATSSEKFVHVPYRSSKLTILLKDAFELSSTRPTQTVVIAHVSPCATDVAHSLNTLRYVAPLKVKAVKPAIDPENPATWTHEQAVRWISETYGGKVDPAILCPYESGLQLCKIPEAEYMRRVLLNPGISEKQAKNFYMLLWEMIVDARTRKRQEKMALDRRLRTEREKNWDEEYLKRTKADVSNHK
jgi:hypothetical protein